MHPTSFLISLFPVLAAAAATEDWHNPTDALVNPKGRKVCLDQCGTVSLKCPEAFWREEHGVCHLCCSTWGETVIRVECVSKIKGVGNATKEVEKGKYAGKEVGKMDEYEE
jgi:hypothetical protein